MTADELLRPGEFAARSRLSAKALRLYTQQGLLVPARVDQRTGYRYYASRQLDRAYLIGLLRRAGMPLARISPLLDLDGPAITAGIGDWWRAAEQDHRVRREIVSHLDRYLTGKKAAMFDVSLREVSEQKLLTAEERVRVDRLDVFIGEARRQIREHLESSGVTELGDLRVFFHGMVTEDSDGPVEVALPFRGSVEPAGALRVRLQPGGLEAYTRLTVAQTDFPGILDAYDAVGRWIEDNSMRRIGSPCEVYFADRHGGLDAAAPFCDVAWPVERADGER